MLLVQSGAGGDGLRQSLSLAARDLGTCLEAVEQGIQQVAANVLVIEYPHKTLPQVQESARRDSPAASAQLSEDVKQQLKELASCG